MDRVFFEKTFRDKGNLLRKVQGAKLPAWDRKVTVEGLPEKHDEKQ